MRRSFQPGKRWSADSHKRKYENDWVVDILEGSANDDFELGYDYHTCGICNLCQDEGCFELAKYLCRMDYVLADMMHMRLVRTQTIAEGATHCDFRYSRIDSTPGKKFLTIALPLHDCPPLPVHFDPFIKCERDIIREHTKNN